MFDLSNLNDYEFECLCRDMMAKILNMPLYIFSRGVDNGVDISDKSICPTIVIQAKHYCGSGYSKLKSSLKKENEKANKLAPQKYYVFTSVSLTRKNKEEIAAIFDNYIPDISYVIDKNDIDYFLSEEGNKDIVFENYKLWLGASNVLSLVNNQHVFIDCDELMADIEKQINFFVKTSSYKAALKQLSKDKVIIIVGAPGVGKSTISKMIVMYAASQNYSVRYVSSNDISTIKNTLSMDPDKKEIVLLDDFLGQHYVNIRDTQPSELKTLLSFVERSKNKKLILNSRITILNEAIERFLVFKNIIEDNEAKKYLINLDDMPIEEKALIFYNHIYFNNLPDEYFRYIKQNKAYQQIVSHKNYNPRIIEYVTKKKNYMSVLPKNYTAYILDKLNNPRDVWNDEYRNRLEPSDRILLTTLYSLSDTAVDSYSLKKAFVNRINDETNIDTTIDHFKDVVTRLNTSLLKSIAEKDKLKVAVVNPSINDFLHSQIENNIAEQLAIIDNAIYFEQIEKVLLSDEAKDHLIERIYQDDFLKMATLENSVFYYFLKYVVKYNLFDKSLEGKVLLSLERAYTDLKYSCREEYGGIISDLFSEKYIDEYATDKLLDSVEKMYYLFKPLKMKEAFEISNCIIKLIELDTNEKLIEQLREQVIEAIIDQVCIEVDEEMSEYASNVIQEADSYTIGGYYNDYSDVLEKILLDKLEDNANEKILVYIEEVNKSLGILFEHFSFENIKYYFDVTKALNEALKNFDDDDDDHEWSRNDNSYHTNEIKAIFER
jgi:hypothetical protein